MSNGVRVRFEPLRSALFSSITTSYTPIGSGFSNPNRLLKVTNLTDGNLLISFDGVNDHDIVAASGFFLYDFCSNKSSTSGLLEQPLGTVVYVKSTGSAPTQGSVYVTVIYASQN